MNDTAVHRRSLFPTAVKRCRADHGPRTIIPTPAGPSQRPLRVGELIRHALSDMLTRGDVHDPVIEGHLITVPEVRMSADLRLATIYSCRSAAATKEVSRRSTATNAICAARSRVVLT